MKIPGQHLLKKEQRKYQRLYLEIGAKVTPAGAGEPLDAARPLGTLERLARCAPPRRRVEADHLTRSGVTQPSGVLARPT